MGDRADISDYAAHLQALAAADLDAARRRAETLRSEAREAARAIIETCKARRVWLYGSLAWGEPHTRSDVDLLVEGAPASAWLDLVAIAERNVHAPVSVLRIEDAPPSLAERVTQEGVVLYESP
jgi:predicted nucleotidyltransferase